MLFNILELPKPYKADIVAAIALQYPAHKNCTLIYGTKIGIWQTPQLCCLEHEFHFKNLHSPKKLAPPTPKQVIVPYINKTYQAPPILRQKFKWDLRGIVFNWSPPSDPGLYRMFITPEEQVNFQLWIDKFEAHPHMFKYEPDKLK